MDCSLPRFSVHGIFQARILSCIAGRRFTLWAIIGNWNAKVGRQEIPGIKSKLDPGVQNEAGERLTAFCQENTLVLANTLFQQHKRRLHTWTSSDGQHRNQIDYILCSPIWRSSIKSAKTRLRADCDSDHELLIIKFRLKLKEVGETTRLFRYDLNRMPYDYTVKWTNGFKGLDLIDRVPEGLWMEGHGSVWEAVIKTISKKKKGKMVIWGGLTNRREKKRS